MQWPTPQDYNETVQSPDFCFDNQELQQGTPETNAMGLPKPICGNFASVYQFECATRNIAVKCFLRNVYNQHQRYGHLSQFTTFNHVSTLLEFEYLLKGILVNGNWFPIVKMPWVEGHTLDQFFRKNMNNRQQLDRFISQFTDLVLELEKSGIAHGDLQHGNIIVREKDLMLVDYDGIYVPAMEGEQANELGHVNYQHPERSAEHFDATIDRFSAWIIHHSMHVLRLDNTLWQRHAGGDERLIFSSADYKNPEGSRLLSELLRHPVPDIQKRAQEIKKLLSMRLHEIPPFRPAGSDTRVDNPVQINPAAEAKPKQATDTPPKSAASSSNPSTKQSSGAAPATGFVMGSGANLAQGNQTQNKASQNSQTTDAPWYADAGGAKNAAGSSGAHGRSGGPGSVLKAAQEYSKKLAESESDEIKIPRRSDRSSDALSNPLNSSPPPAPARPSPNATTGSYSAVNSGAGAPQRNTSEVHIPQRFPRLQLMKDAILLDDDAFSDPELKMGRALKDDQWEGKNGFVLRIAGKEKHYAVKVFLADSAERKQRYESIARHNMKEAGKYLVSFQYQSKGLHVGEQWLPILRMGYIDGKRLDDYVRFQLRNENKHEIQRIINQFRDMVWALNAAGIAHGDLEPSNILVDSRGNLRLVDYDNMYVPALAHLQSSEIGHPLFQHPTRTLGHYGPYLDNFSALVIDSVLSCMALAPHESLWNWETFIQQLRPSNSWNRATGNQQQDATQRAARLIREMQKYRIDQVPTLNASR